MTIDERLEKLVERHEALAQSFAANEVHLAHLTDTMHRLGRLENLEQ